MKISREDFFTKASSLFDEYDLVYINLATALIGKIYYGQKRSNGEHCFAHLIRVADLTMISGEWPSAYQVITALLHDVMEDCVLPRDLIKSLFNEEIDEAVRILSKKICIYDGDGKVKGKQRISDEKYFYQISQAPAWIREVKIADRLDNINSMRVWKKPRQKKYLRETRKYILPMAAATDSPLSQKLKRKYKELKKELF